MVLNKRDSDSYLEQVIRSGSDALKDNSSSKNGR
jgi:hypothetical protein